MKKVVWGIMALFFSTAVWAQKQPEYIAKPRFNIGAEFGLPTTGSYAELFTIGFGGSGKLEVPVTKTFYATATAGFITYYLKEGVSPTYNRSYIPLKAGGKYYFNPMIYAEGELGISIGMQRKAGSAFVWAPGVGTSFSIAKDGYLDAGIRYEGWERNGGNLDQFALRVAYKF
ncbi:hypothetical protein FW774_15925 [Pedobacter sp. BS3]|uniref:hypothetical protein n=1 Tax=Pedobacter sp. BS3 TaxID=2567937 RepID=UPI0011ED1CE9|nr:hypothetical protein [Pedobacter sp. BS3]TZF82178.1 hypothetical protein FW774_15925 [Pedobacter sp. BS3]